MSLYLQECPGGDKTREIERRRVLAMQLAARCEVHGAMEKQFRTALLC